MAGPSSDHCDTVICETDLYCLHNRKMFSRWFFSSKKPDKCPQFDYHCVFRWRFPSLTVLAFRFPGAFASETGAAAGGRFCCARSFSARPWCSLVKTLVMIPLYDTVVNGNFAVERDFVVEGNFTVKATPATSLMAVAVGTADWTSSTWVSLRCSGVIGIRRWTSLMSEENDGDDFWEEKKVKRMEYSNGQNGQNG